MKMIILAVVAVATFAAVFATGAGYIVKGCPGVALAADELKASGVVESVDADKGVLVIETKGSDEMLTLEAEADELKDLKKGDKVKVRYTEGDKNMATYIRKIGPMVIVGC